MTKEALIIFAKNPEAGKVKTRLAATIGNEAALAIYNQLIAHTISITKDLPIDKYVFYVNEITQSDTWDDNIFYKKLQNGNDLGERMKNAFATLFKKGYTSVVIIGTDCPGLDGYAIMDAFTRLDLYDVTIGPSADGGYYLLGCKCLHSALFENIAWSTSTVLKDTEDRCAELKLDYDLLPVLNDIDEEKDLVYLEQSGALQNVERLATFNTERHFEMHPRKPMNELQLLFVYNAKGDLFNSLTDFAHKIISPATYECQLCKLTYGHFLIKQEWKNFIEKLPLKSVFVYKDQFEKLYPVKADFPAIFVRRNGMLEKIVSEVEIGSCKTLEELITLINQKMVLLSNSLDFEKNNPF